MKEDMKKVVYCPHCKRKHLDARWYAYRPHKTHQCLYKDCWKKFDTKEECVGVREVN